MVSDNWFYDYLIQKSPPYVIFWPHPGLKLNKMSALEKTKRFEQNFSGKHIIKMNTKTLHELWIIAKDKGLHGYYKLTKADLVVLLLEQSAEEEQG